MRKANNSILRMVELAILTALVIILQLTGVAIKIPFLGTSVSLVLIPITLGAMLLGPAAGAWLGFVFGFIVYVCGGVMGMDTFTAFLFQNNPVITAGICFIKSTLAGFLCGISFRVLTNKLKLSVLTATFISAAVTAIVNTGVFVLGCLLIQNTLGSFMSVAGIGGTVIYFIFIGLAGFNFIFEMLLNMVLSPALHRIYTVITSKL